MKHLSEFMSTPKELYKAGHALAVNLYFYLPLNKTVVFFRRKGDLLTEEDIQKIQALPKNTLLIHRSDSGKSVEAVSSDISKKINSGSLASPEVRESAAAVLSSINALEAPDEEPTHEAAVQALAGVPKLVEQVITKLERSPSVRVYEEILNESKYQAQDPIGMHHSQVSSVAVLMLLTAAGDPTIGKGIQAKPDTLANLGAAGLIHDLGLSSIPKAVTERHLRGEDDELTVSEKLVFMRHVDKTIELLRGSGMEVADEVLQAIEFHHENYNGTGFRGISGGQIPLLARILRIADDLVACINHPTNVFGFKEALANLAMRDRHLESPIYDPDLMNALAAIEG